MSAAGKARIIAALKKRWAAFHKAKAAPGKKAAPKVAVKKAVKKSSARKKSSKKVLIPAPVAPAAPVKE